MKTTIAKDKNEYLFNVKFKGMTQGQVIALFNALESHDTAVGHDVYMSLNKAIGVSDLYKKFPIYHRCD